MFWKKRTEGTNRTKVKTPIQAVATITEEELVGRFAGVENQPLYLAVRAVIDNERLRLVNEALEEGLTEVKLRHRMGGAAALSDLVEELETMCQRAREQGEKDEVRRQNAEAA